MFWIHLIFLSIWQSVCATPTPYGHHLERKDAEFTLKRTTPLLSKRELKVTDNVFLLKEVTASTRSSSALLSDAAGATTPLSSILDGISYGVEVELAGQSFELIFDTGSSDLWVAQTGFICLNSKGSIVPERKCHFGKLFTGTFEDGKVPDEHINIPYGDGNVVAGVLGYEDVTVAGVTVDHQEIGLIQEAYWTGDGVSSGILGFAYSTLTSAYKGKNLGGDKLANLVHYTNFIGNVIKQGKINPVFSIVLERDGGASQLALGGLPTISFDHDFTTVPLDIYEFSPKLPIGAKKYTYYTIEVGGFVLDSKNIGSSLHAIVDSGTTIAYLPAAITKTINEAFNPPAKLKGGLWEVSCNAKAPSFAITIGGTDFVISAAELLLPKALSYDPTTGLCVTGIQPSAGGTPPVLGGTFLKNVVAVFDIGAAEMRFAPHVKY